MMFLKNQDLCMMLRIVRALNKRRSARYTFFSALQCLSYDYNLYICSYTDFASYLVLFCQFRISRLLRVYVKIHPTLVATSLLEDLEDLTKENVKGKRRLVGDPSFSV